MKKSLLVLALGIVTLFPALAEGQQDAAYPSKTIEIVVPSKAGGSTDAMARIFAQVAKKHLPGAEFAVVNKPGSGGQQGFEYIAAAKPDGYTLGTVFTVQLPSHIVSGRARYTLDDFYYLGMVLDDPSIIVVPKNSPVNSLEELIEASKSGEMTASVNGIGSDDHLAMMLFQDASGTAFQVIPAAGSSEQKASIMGGHIDVAFMNFSQMVAQHQSGDVKILAVLSDERNEDLPELPTAKELGYDVNMKGTRGFVIQKDAPAEIQSKLRNVMNLVVNDPEFKKALEAANQTLFYRTGDEYEAYMHKLKADMEPLFVREPW